MPVARNLWFPIFFLIPTVLGSALDHPVNVLPLEGSCLSGCFSKLTAPMSASRPRRSHPGPPQAARNRWQTFSSVKFDGRSHRALGIGLLKQPDKQKRARSMKQSVVPATVQESGPSGSPSIPAAAMRCDVGIEVLA